MDLAGKLKLFAEYNAELEKIFSDNTDEKILADSLKYHPVERLFQLLVDAMADMESHLPEDFSLKITPLVMVRNQVIDEYDSLNPGKFISACRKNLSDFKGFYIKVADFIK